MIWENIFFTCSFMGIIWWCSLKIQKTKIMASGPITSWQIDRETVETVADFIFLGSKITADGDCSHEIKRCLLLERKVMTNLYSISKSRDITLPKKVHLVKAMVFPVVMYGCEFSSVQFSRSVVSNSLQPHELQHARPPCPSPTSWNSLKLMYIELVMPSNYLILCHPLLLLPPIPPSISHSSVIHKAKW